MRVAVLVERAAPSLERAHQAAVTFALAVYGFVVLFSTAGTSLAVGLVLLLTVLSCGRFVRLRPWRVPLHTISLLLLAYIVLRTLLADGSANSAFSAFRKYHELLLLPLLWALMRNARRPQAFALGLLVSAVLFCIAYWVALTLRLGKDSSVGMWLHMHRISASFGLAVCAFIVCEHGRLGLLPRAPAYGLAAFLAATVAFALDGRTGYAVLLFLLLCCAWRAAPRRGRLTAVVAALAFALLAGALSGSIRHRVLETVRDAQQAHAGVVKLDSSTGIRFEIWSNAVGAARTHWIVGTGWDGYSTAAQEAARRRHGKVSEIPGSVSDNPHSEYLMQFVSGGVPALLLYLLWLAFPVLHAVHVRHQDDPWAGVAACVSLAFALASLFNSVLLDYIEAHFYVAVLAWLLVRRVRA